MTAPLTEAAAFFYAHAGYSYPQGATDAEQETARRDSALELAAAERQRKAAGAWIRWEPDPDGQDSACACDRQDCPGKTGPWWQAELFTYGPNGETAVSLASLGGIDASPGSDGARVIEAQLALESLTEIQAAREAGA